MGALRVVLYAEGYGETGGELTMPPAPGDVLSESSRGPAHALIRRAIARARSMPEPAIVFEQPLRAARGRIARGADLHHPATLRRLLTWAQPQRRPDLAIVLVDQDGLADRKRTLDEATRDLRVTRLIAVAVQEFESWLIADQACVHAAVGRSVPTPSPPESLPAGEAKRLLSDWIGPADGHQVRMTLAGACDLDVLSRRCPSFLCFVREAEPRVG